MDLQPKECVPSGRRWGTSYPRNQWYVVTESPLATPIYSSCLFLEGVSILLRQMIEQHQPSNPVEDMVKGAASGDVVRVEELLRGGACGVDDQFNGRTAVQAAAENGHIDVVRTLIHFNANLEEQVSGERS